MSVSLSEITQQNIIQLIKTNALDAGDKLPTEYELADRLNVGRSTIREAVKALASRNILKIKQGAGTFVSSERGMIKDPLGLSLINDDVNLAFDMINVRLIFEPEMAALAATNATEDDCAAIGEACTVVEKLIENSNEYSTEDSAFHEAIARASGNKIIDRIVKVIHSSVQKNIFVTEDSLKNDTLIYHRQIFQAIKDNDIVGARCGMIMHLNNLRNFILKKRKP
ncbi:FadR/GntR family transcriptional regulator [Pectinatus haikarae]|uniref:FadR/GntR family transcriptional regulator n=1 Tax=Pectinatus haikarae TaxID=349096 RepID=UPI0018C5E392|nr:FadR/GntR family transcriptional regulator [Pectinatus haikarae]